ncbi:MAG: hypothetical protein U1D06_04710, partial [Paracoccaceae bacterium]|nr:hypothetical protein [Paracoccaceae bacterium]
DTQRVWGLVNARIEPEWLSAQVPNLFARKHFVLTRNFDRLSGYDALIAPECNSAAQLRKLGYHGVLIGTRHGAGDRAGSFNPNWQKLDLVLLPGEKYQRRFKEEGFRWTTEISGWPKLDLFDAAQPLERPLFDNGLPTALYAPHFSKTLSSLHRFGADLITHFAQRDDWNLIVAPHVVLFSRRLRNLGLRFGQWRDHPRIRIDKGSFASVDMTYLKGADLYIGDISSQVYEFIVRPRPCIFLNAARIDWQDDPHFANWHLGEVIDDPALLDPAIDRADTLHRQTYQVRQQVAVADTFHAIDGQAAARGADAIFRLLDARPALPGHD